MMLTLMLLLLMMMMSCVMCRYSVNVESSVVELVESLRQPLSEDEREKMLRLDTAHHETDAYTTLLNYFTQKNTDALVKCMCIFSLILPLTIVLLYVCGRPNRHCGFCESVRLSVLFYWPLTRKRKGEDKPKFV